MAITKSAEEAFTKEALIIPGVGGAAVGGLRASGLSEEQKQALIKKHDLGPNASFILRNAGRGAVGEAGGALVGGIGGTMLGGGLGALISGGNPEVVARFGTMAGLGGLVGGIGLGTKLMTDKYTRAAGLAAMKELAAKKELTAAK